MKRIAIFGTSISDDHQTQAVEIIQKFIAAGFDIFFYSNFKQNWNTSFNFNTTKEFDDISTESFDAIISLGGDGTFLKCAHLCYKNDTPILGINFGKLGFLAQTKPDDIDFIISQLQQETFSIRKRSILDFSFQENNITHEGIGVNEITLQKSNAVKLIKINIFVSEKFLCSFWADGVAVSTPTGSTGYSLSLGSPILSPDNQSIVITPIAPHTLSVRPIVIPDSEIVTIEATGEYTNFLISNDFQSLTLQNEPTMRIKKSTYAVSTIEFNNTNFFETLREKLKLGYDIRK